MLAARSVVSHIDLVVYTLVLRQAFSLQVCPPWCSVMLSGWPAKGEVCFFIGRLCL